MRLFLSEFVMRIPFITTLAGASLALGGCAYGNLGLGAGYGSPYGTYGYNSPYYGSSYGPYASIGYGSGYGLGYGMGYGYGSPYYGWYDGFYYPGTGYYVYDTYRRPRVWTDAQRVYWTQRVATVPSTQRTTIQPNWSEFSRQRATRTTRLTTRPTRTQTVEARKVERQQRTQSVERKRAEREERRSNRRTSDED